MVGTQRKQQIPLYGESQFLQLLQLANAWAIEEENPIAYVSLSSKALR